VRCFFAIVHRMREFDGAPIANAPATSQRLSNIRVSIPAEILAYARAAYPQRRSSNANSLQSQTSAGLRQICAIFQRESLPRLFRIRVLHAQPCSRVSVGHVRSARQRSGVRCRGLEGSGGAPSECTRSNRDPSKDHYKSRLRAARIHVAPRQRFIPNIGGDAG
jgi:hypothetical protein